MATNANYIGSGFITLRDTSGNAYPAGTLQNVSLSIKADLKELLGDKKVAVLTAEVGKKISLKAKNATLNSALIGAVLGGTTATGSKAAGTVAKTASASSATVAATDFGSPAGWAFVADAGVVYTATGQPLKYNSGTLASTGEYKNTAGVYTFGSGDATAAVTISCIYSVTGGETSTAQNQAIGLSTYMSIYLMEQTTQADGTVRKVGFYFPAVIIGSLDLGFTNNDFATQDLEITVFADSSGKVAEIYAL